MPTDRKLQVVTPQAYAFQVECPTCGYVVDNLPMEETPAGSYVVSGADRYPVCDQCEVQYEIGEVSVEPVEPVHGP